MYKRAAEKLSEALDAGEPWAIQLTIKLNLPHGITSDLYGLEPSDIEQAVIDGELSPQQADALTATKIGTKSINELDDHREQIAKLEQQER